jgi:peptide chain release factor 2
MAATDPTDEISELSSKLDTIEAVLDPEAMQTEAADLREQAADPGLWEDQTRAQQVTRRLSYLEGELSRLESLRQRLDDTRVLFELADDEHDQSARDEAARDLAELRADVDQLEVRTLLSGDYDEREALITINSQAGGADAEDFAGNLQRMYLRWAERHKYSAEVYDVSYGEAGIKSTTFVVKAPYAYGTLRGEQGTHRMVRISKYDNQGRRQTSFAGVDVVPVVEQTDHIDIPDDEIRVDVFRSSGPGGQGVNTTDSAVRITHLPTGIVVSCQNERSQIQNRASAMAVLQAKLLERRRQEEADELAALKGDGGRAWGSQIRNYVLYPYQMVKDQRTGYETTNATAVLDGEIDDFIDAEIRWLRRGENDDKQLLPGGTTPRTPGCTPDERQGYRACASCRPLTRGAWCAAA